MKFEAKVNYTRIDPTSGKEKNVTENYILDSETFGDAENTTIKAVSELTQSPFTKAIKISDVSEIIGNMGDNYYKAKVMLTDMDPLSGKEKVTPTILLVRASIFSHAHTLVTDWCYQSICDTEIDSIRKVAIVDQIPFTQEHPVLTDLKDVKDVKDLTVEYVYNSDDDEEEIPACTDPNE